MEGAEGEPGWLEGERFVVQRSVVGAEKMDLLAREKREDAVAVFHPRGIVVLSAGAANGKMEAFSYKAMKSFGATDESCFGFKVPAKNVDQGGGGGAPKSPRGGGEGKEDVFVCLVNECVGIFVCFVLDRGVFFIYFDCFCTYFFFQYSEESAHLQNALLMRYARRWEEMKERKEEPPHFPSSYSTAEEE